MLNKQKGNMYGFITHTWNPIKGSCKHNCSYCYMKKWNITKPPWIDEKSFKDDISGKKIFIGSSTDMFANNISSEWIKRVLQKCKEAEKSEFLFQTKNPRRFQEFAFPSGSALCITLESNYYYPQIMREANTPVDRTFEFLMVKEPWKMVTIEPIMTFDLHRFVMMLKLIKPFQVNIGADSGGNGLPEPTAESVKELIFELEKFTKVFQKDNLKRITR